MNYKNKAARAVALLLPALAAILLYLPALKFGKVWDDWALMPAGPAQQDPTQWLRLLAQPLPFAENYFRPLVMFTYLLEAWSGAGGFASHLVNILLHAFNALLVTLLAQRLWPQMPWRLTAAVLAGLAYALYPPLSEVAIWLSGRFDLMMVSFVLLGLLADASERPPLARALLAGLALSAGLFCKEMAVVMPVALLALRLARSGDSLKAFVFAREQLMLYAALCAGLCIYLVVRHAALGYLAQPLPEMNVVDLGTPLNRLLLVGMTFAGYLHMTLLPFMNIQPLHYIVFPIGTDTVVAWVGLLEMALAVALLAWLYRQPRWRFLACGLGAALLSLAPVLHFTPVPMVLGNMWMADRMLTLPLALFLLSLGPLFAVALRPATARLAALFAVAWLSLSALLVHAITPLWQDDLSIWHWLTEDFPTCSQCHTNFSVYLLQASMAKNALSEADLAVKYATQPWHKAVAHSARANVLGVMGRRAEALSDLDLASAAEDRGKFDVQRAALLYALGRDAEARAALEAAARKGEHDEEAVALMARIEQRIGAPRKIQIPVAPVER